MTVQKMFLIKNRAFRRGFLAGLRSPYEVLGGRSVHFDYRPSNLVALSWLQVGQSLREAMSEEDKKNGKGANTSLQVH